jgi:hypothetical protein
MTEDFTALHGEIADARAELVANLSALVAKTDVKTNVRHRFAGLGHRITAPLRRGRSTAAITGATTVILVIVLWSVTRANRGDANRGSQR